MDPFVPSSLARISVDVHFPAACSGERLTHTGAALFAGHKTQTDSRWRLPSHRRLRLLLLLRVLRSTSHETGTSTDDESAGPKQARHSHVPSITTTHHRTTSLEPQANHADRLAAPALGEGRPPAAHVQGDDRIPLREGKYDPVDAHTPTHPLTTPHPLAHPLQHHAGYVTKLNGMVPGTEWEGKELDDIMLKAPAGGLFNNAAQSTYE